MVLIGIWRVVDGYRNGIVKEIISLITLVILALATVLISKAISAYFDKQIINMASAVISATIASNTKKNAAIRVISCIVIYVVVTTVSLVVAYSVRKTLMN